MQLPPPFSAVLLAAGRSTRMGRDKALLEIDGVPMWRRQRDVLACAGATEIFLSARPEQTWLPATTGFTATVHDALAGGGPIVGLTAGLERAMHPLVAVLAVDLPQMTSGWFTTLQAESTAGVGVVGRREGHFEPLAALYPRNLKWLAWEALARHEYSLQRLVTQAADEGLVRVHEITDAEAPLFTNWNFPNERG